MVISTSANNINFTAHSYILLCIFFNSSCFQYILRNKRLTSLVRNDEKSNFWPWQSVVDLYTSSTYTQVNKVPQNRTAPIQICWLIKLFLRYDIYGISRQTYPCYKENCYSVLRWLSRLHHNISDNMKIF